MSVKWINPPVLYPQMRTLKNINIKQCIINKKADKHNLNFVNYRLYVFAFGSLMTVILNCLTLISVSFLHFGQNSGNFSSTVSSLIFTRVLFLHTGHNNHCNDFSCSCNIFVSPFSDLLLYVPANWPQAAFISEPNCVLIFTLIPAPCKTLQKACMHLLLGGVSFWATVVWLYGIKSKWYSARYFCAGIIVL